MGKVPAEPPQAGAAWDPLDRTLASEFVAEAGPVSKRLHSRLREQDLEAMRAALSDDEAALLAARSGDRTGMHLEIAYALARVPGVAERTGLSAAEPPEDVHAMVRGTHTLGGAYGYADAMAETLESSGYPLERAGRVLDFGCSSGRLVRALHAAYGEVAFAGCDPLEDAIAWARANLPGIAFSQTGREPPLPYEDGAFGAVLALSVWSHFAEPAAVRWFGEMHRVLEPGGRLAVSLQGFAALQRLAEVGAWERTDIDDAARGLYRTGFHFRDVFGEEGDWGLSNEQWGWAFVSPEWIQAHLCPQWAVVQFRPGYLDDFQDLLVLEPRPSLSAAS